MMITLYSKVGIKVSHCCLVGSIFKCNSQKTLNPTKNPSKALQQGSRYRVLRPRGWEVEASTAPRSCPSHQQHAPSALGPAPAGVHCSCCPLCRQESPSSFHHLPALSPPPTPGQAHPTRLSSDLTCSGQG